MRSYSPEYSIAKCSPELYSDYLEYLRNSRKHELQADRFSGYIMALYGASLEQSMRWLNSVLDVTNEILSTHPKKEKRKKAIEEGFKDGKNET